MIIDYDIGDMTLDIIKTITPRFREELLSKQFRMGAGSVRYNFFRSDGVNKQPVRINMTFPAMLPFSNQPMILVLRGNRSFIQQQLHEHK